MPCKVKNNMIVCSSLNHATPCAYCPKRHTKLCDYIIKKPIFGKRGSGITCDKPMCGEHTWWDGTKYFCRDHAVPA